MRALIPKQAPSMVQQLEMFVWYVAWCA